jgi:hypothetical protein
MIYMTISLIIVLILIAVMQYFNNKKMENQLLVLNNVIKLKNTTIENLESSRVAVKDVIENLSFSDEVMRLVREGLSREEISKKLNIPLAKVELIVKFDKIKKEQ